MIDAASLGATVTKAAVSIAGVVGRRLLGKRQRQKIAAEAAATLVAGNFDRFVEHLSTVNLRLFQDFVRSPQFDDLVRQAMLLSLASSTNDETRTAFREQLRHGLRHRRFPDSEMLQATDVLEELVQAAVHAVRQSTTPGTLDSGRAVTMAALVAAAQIRNSELLQRIDSLTDIDQFARAVRNATKAAHAKLRLATHSMNRQVEYAQLYVTPVLRPADSYPWAYATGPDTYVTLADAILHTLRFVILGDPGAGKSTLAAKLAHDIAADKMTGLEGQVPLLLVVRSHTQSLRSDHQALTYYLEAACRRPGNVVPPPDALEYLLLNGRATVIIDGVDELGDSAYRRSFAQLVEGFAHRYPLARMIVTSRIIGYGNAPLDFELFPTIGIGGFTDAQVSEYARHWFRLDSTLDADTRQLLTEAFMQESEIARDLRANPLVLSLLCSLYSSTHYIPRNRPEIYEKCAELLFETWDRSRGIEIAHRYGAHIRPAVQRMAWRVFTDDRGRQALPRAEFITVLAEYMGRKFDDPDEATQAAADFIDFCAGRAWVLTDVGSDAFQPHYGFVHRTFLEYFAASQLVKHQPEPAAVWAQVQQRLDDSSWTVVAQLALQILDRQLDNGADQLLDLALSSVEAVEGKGARLPALTFAAMSLDSVAPDNATIRGIARLVVAHAVQVPTSQRRSNETPGPILMDGPLNLLLKIAAPDNVDRVAHAIADAIHDEAQAVRAQPSAGLLFDALMHPWYPTAAPKGLTAECLARYNVPANAVTWHRILNHPTPDDIVVRGVALFYKWTVAATAVQRPLLMQILEQTVAPSPANPASSGPGWTEALEQYYPHLLKNAHVLATTKLPEREWDSRLSRFSDHALMSMSASARAALLLLILPVLQTAAPARDPHSLQRFIIAARNGYRQAAGDIINSWILPKEAHHFLITWITNAAPTQPA